MGFRRIDVFDFSCSWTAVNSPSPVMCRSTSPHFIIRRSTTSSFRLHHSSSSSPAPPSIQRCRHQVSWPAQPLCMLPSYQDNTTRRSSAKLSLALHQHHPGDVIARLDGRRRVQPFHRRPSTSLDPPRQSGRCSVNARQRCDAERRRTRSTFCFFFLVRRLRRRWLWMSSRRDGE